MHRHSGKLLSDVPYADIEIGMEILSERNQPGMVLLKMDLHAFQFHGIETRDNWLRLRWRDGKEIARRHGEFNNIKVK